MGSWLRSRSSVAFSSSPVVQSSPLPSLSAVPVLPAGRVKLIRLLFTPWVECGVAASGILCVVCRRCTAKGQRASKQNNPATMDATIYVRKRGFRALNFVNMTCAGPLNFSNMTPSPGSMNQSALQLNRPPQPSGRIRDDSAFLRDTNYRVKTILNCLFKGLMGEADVGPTPCVRHCVKTSIDRGS